MRLVHSGNQHIDIIVALHRDRERVSRHEELVREQQRMRTHHLERNGQLRDIDRGQPDNLERIHFDRGARTHGNIANVARALETGESGELDIARGAAHCFLAADRDVKVLLGRKLEPDLDRAPNRGLRAACRARRAFPALDCRAGHRNNRHIRIVHGNLKERAAAADHRVQDLGCALHNTFADAEQRAVLRIDNRDHGHHGRIGIGIHIKVVEPLDGEPGGWRERACHGGGSRRCICNGVRVEHGLNLDLDNLVGHAELEMVDGCARSWELDSARGKERTEQTQSHGEQTRALSKEHICALLQRDVARCTRILSLVALVVAVLLRGRRGGGGRGRERSEFHC
eukprot:comp22380_c0_seq1/m.54254 comp22380_c0_seq1/g.54254  ORF comp22380_c0_seq1/g.54254 comp22380_c0_seq1/m.54254 type:complete len:342 (+) comp22380_c0_seq1:1216-2241(+)